MAGILKANQVLDAERNLIIDVRTPSEFFNEHIPDSQNIPLDNLAEKLDSLGKMSKVIISCQSGLRAQRACQELQQINLPNLYLLEEGILGWKKAKRQTVSTRKGISIMQQVQIIAGLLIITGTMVSWLWPLALMAGIGLLMAGLTNTCLMATILEKMPWNKIS